MTKLYVMLRNFLGDQRGVSAIEYAILAGVIIAAVIAGLAFLDFDSIFTTLDTKIDDAINPPPAAGG